MSSITISSPTRVDLAGGTLDLWPLYCLTGGATTVNLAIDIRTHATVEDCDQIILSSADLGETKAYPNLQAVLNDADPKWRLLQLVLKQIQPQGNFKLTTRSESPVGGGLGGSSSLMISILKAFEKRQGKTARSVHQLVHLAHNLEAEILNTPTGTQDYYPAASGGVNILTYSGDGIHQEVLPLKNTPFETRFLLVHTGRSHHSGLNNFEVLKSAVGKDTQVLKALHSLKEVALEMAQAVKHQDWQALAPLFRREYASRIQLTPAFTCPEIEALDRISREAGADAIKICGAGGGGCVMVWCPEGARETISQACRKAGFPTLNAGPVAPIS